jgi:hypothetical protein
VDPEDAKVQRREERARDEMSQEDYDHLVAYALGLVLAGGAEARCDPGAPG